MHEAIKHLWHAHTLDIDCVYVHIHGQSYKKIFSMIDSDHVKHLFFYETFNFEILYEMVS